jgi:hypothetical protein
VAVWQADRPMAAGRGSAGRSQVPGSLTLAPRAASAAVAEERLRPSESESSKYNLKSLSRGTAATAAAAAAAVRPSSRSRHHSGRHGGTQPSPPVTPAPGPSDSDGARLENSMNSKFLKIPDVVFRANGCGVHVYPQDQLR